MDQEQQEHHNESRYDENRKMMALTYHGKKNMKVEEVPVPLVTEPTDAIIRVTATTVCGSDLHLYYGLVPQVKTGDILGHESIGIVDDVGPGVTKFKKGDRVVISSVISCGKCWYCLRGFWSCCDNTNDSKL